MRILIDARKLGDGGIGVYIENLIHGLSALEGVRVSALCPSSKIAAWTASPQLELIAEDTRPYSLAELTVLGRRADPKKFDLYHAPHYTLPFGLKIPAVVTVHDMIHVYSPERRFYPWIAAPLIYSALRRAGRILTVSEASCDQLCRFMGEESAARSKIRVVPNAVDPLYLVERRATDAGRSVNSCYLLCVLSMLKPHKGVEDLVWAFRGLLDSASSPAELASRVKLVLAGRGTEQRPRLQELVASAGLEGRISIAGAVSKDQLAQLYGGALALVVPSRAEGFCLPVIEAKACGVPVVARPVPAVKELTGECDVVCRDFRIESLTEGLAAALTRAATAVQPAWSDALARTRREVAAKYDRVNVARQVLSVYMEACGR